MVDWDEFLSNFKSEDIIRLAVEPNGDPALRLAGLRVVSSDRDDFSREDDLVDLAVRIVRDIIRDLAQAVPAEEDPLDSEAAVLRRLMANLYWEEVTTGRLFRIYGETSPWLQPDKSEEWPWPQIRVDCGRRTGTDLGPFSEVSALGLFGYSVAQAKQAEWPDGRRHRFLSDFMEKKLPPIVQEKFGDEYGRPMSTDRLRKIANVIAGNCGLRIRRDPHAYRYSISKWNLDLEYLKTKYYDGAGLKFVPWPDPSDTIL